MLSQYDYDDYDELSEFTPYSSFYEKVNKKILALGHIATGNNEYLTMDEIPHLYCHYDKPCYEFNPEKETKFYFSCDAHYRCFRSHPISIPLATKEQLKKGILFGADGKPTGMGNNRNFTCKNENSSCYHIDSVTNEKIYYTCDNARDCHPIRLKNDDSQALSPNYQTADTSDKIEKKKTPKIRRHVGNPHRPHVYTVHRLADKSQLEKNVILDRHDHVTTLDKRPGMHCQYDYPCYRIAPISKKRVYYNCKTDSYCEEMRLNNKDIFYFYLDSRGNITTQDRARMVRIRPLTTHVIRTALTLNLICPFQENRLNIAALDSALNTESSSAFQPYLAHRLATETQLQGRPIQSRAGQLTTLDQIDNVACQDDGPCHRIDAKTNQDIYYTCVNETYCYEMTIDDNHSFYFYDTVSIATS